jgi:hypothetical protein
MKVLKKINKIKGFVVLVVERKCIFIGMVDFRE